MTSDDATATADVTCADVTSAAPAVPADDSDGALHRAGWDEQWDAAARRRAAGGQAPGYQLGRVLRVDRTTATVLLADGVVEAMWGPELRRAVRDDPTAAPAAGDWVRVDASPGTGGGAPAIADVLPRRTSVTRLQVGGSSHGQVLVANADVVAVVEALAPDLDRGRIERLLALAWGSGAMPMVVLTKADLVAHPQALAAEAAEAAPGCTVLVTASVDGQGLDPLRRLLAEGRTIALLGASGVGKSTLLTALVGTAAMRTQVLGAVNKGRHTTVTRELHLVPGGGAVVDTPGLRSVGLAGQEDLQGVFADVLALAAGCRFADCAHDREPGCAVAAAVASGTLQPRRLASYRKLLRETEYQASRVDARLRRQREARGRALRGAAAPPRP